MKAQIVSFHCVLRDKLGRVVSSSFNRDVINQLETESDEVLKGLVAGLQNVKSGEKRQIYVPAAQAYGLYDPGLVVEVPRKQLQHGKSLELGNEVMTQCESDGHSRTFRVVDTASSFVVLDGNHPLAGQDLTFEIEIVTARDASAQDLQDQDESASRNKLH